MGILDSRRLKAQARQALGLWGRQPGKLVLLHTGASIGLILICTVVSLLLQQQIDLTGGLDGLGLRSVLSTANTLVQLLANLVLPFWELGFLFAMLKVARGQQPKKADLTEGFRRFFPLLRLNLAQIAVYLGLFFLCYQVGTTVFVMTPFGADFLALSQTMTDLTAMGEAEAEALLQSMIPLYVITGVLFAALAIPVFYRFRMAQYLLLDDPNGRALAALAGSRYLMRGNCWGLFRLDLSLWWYYGLEILLGLVCYGDLILSAVGVTLPVSATAGSLLFYGLYLAGLLGLNCWKKPQLQTIYAGAYETLRERLQQLQVEQ